MSLSELPHPIEALVDAFERRDLHMVLGRLGGHCFEKGGVVVAKGTLAEKGLQAYDPAFATVRAVDGVRLNDDVTVTFYARRRDDDGTTYEFTEDWRFRVCGDGVKLVAIVPSDWPPLPHVVTDLIGSINLAEPDRALRLFAEDSLVNDQLCEYWGRAAIRNWVDDTISQQNLTIRPVEVIDQGDDIVVRGNVNGRFDSRGLPDPLTLNFYLTVAGGYITRLVVLPRT